MSAELTENTPLISNEGGGNQVRPVGEENRQLRITYLIHFLSTISTAIFNTNISYSANYSRFMSFFGFTPYRSFIIGQILLGLIWGYYSDKIGRKRVLNICLLGSALMMFLFGFCDSIGSAVFVSFLVGAFSCVYNVIRTIFGESTNKSNRPLSFIFLIIITGIACYIGICISVLFSWPAINRPSPPGSTPNQPMFNFLVSCSIACGINIIAFILSYLYLSETLGNSVNLEENNTAISSDNDSNILAETELYNIFGLNISKDSILVLCGFPLIATIFTGFSAIFLSWSRNEVSKGGLGLKLMDISTYQLVSLTISLVALILYSTIHKRLGSLKLYKIFFLPAAAVLILSSMATLVARTGNLPALATLVIFIFSALGIFDYLQGTSLNLLVIESSESTGNLGMLFGISGVLENTFNLIVPILFKSIYKFSTERGLPFPLNHSLVWTILTTVALIGYWSSSKIKNL